MRIALPIYSLVLLGLGTWLLYVCDRILDGLRGSTQRLRPRHHFYARHRRSFLLCGALGAGVLIWLIVSRMNHRARAEDTLLFLAALLYFLLIHCGSKSVETWLPKELIVGILFASATAVPAWSRMLMGREILLPSVLLFAALCWLNCVAIEKWESKAGGRNAPQNFTTLWTGRHLEGVAVAVAMLSLMVVGAMWSDWRRLAGLDIGISMSALSILGLHRYREGVPALQLRIAADVALLTPLLALPLFG